MKRNRMLLCSSEELQLVRRLALNSLHPDSKSHQHVSKEDQELCVEIVNKIDHIL